MRRTWLIGAAVVTTLAASGPAAAAQREVINGHWQSVVNCAFTNYNPLTGKMSCLGSTLWTGALRGVTHYVAKGSYDVLTGNSTGSLHETFRGRDQAGHRGTIVFDEVYLLDGPKSTIQIVAVAVGGTGGFAGIRGTLTFVGSDNVAAGSGTFFGVLKLRSAGAKP